MFITFAGTSGPSSQQLKFGGSGSGGIDTLKQNFPDNQICFALASMADKIDDSVTVKFIWICWLGNSVGTMMKARLSTQLGAVKAFMGQAHITHNCSSQSEISQDILREKVMATSGSGSKVIDESTGQSQLKSQNSTTSIAARQVHKQDDGALFSDECAQLLADVRNDNTPTTWAAFTYPNPNSQQLVKLGSGNGDVTEVAAVLKDDNVVYALVRKLETIDATVAVKFCYIRWLGENIPRMQKAKLGASAATIQQLFSPYHVSLDSPDKNEVTDENIMKLIMIASGTYQHTLEGPRQTAKPQVQKPVEQAPVQSQPVKTVQTVKPVSLSSGGQDTTKVGAGQVRGMGGEKVVTHNTRVDGIIQLADEEAILNGIRAVRSDADPANWCAITYTAPKSSAVKFAGSGSGGLEEMRALFKNDAIIYGLIRCNEQIDDTVAVKFCFIDWRGENINRMQRANLGIHSGEVTALFHPYHTDVQAADNSEVTMDIIMKKIKFASGTAVHVK